MKRKFQSDRLHKILKIIVNVVAGVSLLFAIYGSINYDKNTIFYLDKFSECFKKEVNMEICGVYVDGMSNFQDSVRNFWLVGILLPIAFYGGGKLFNYLFPRDVNTEEVK